MSDIYFRTLQYASKSLFDSNLFFYHPLMFSMFRKYISLAFFHSRMFWSMGDTRGILEGRKDGVSHCKSLCLLYISDCE